MSANRSSRGGTGGGDRVFTRDQKVFDECWATLCSNRVPAVEVFGSYVVYLDDEACTHHASWCLNILEYHMNDINIEYLSL